MFTHNWEEITFLQDNDLWHSSKYYIKTNLSQQKKQNFGNYDIGTSFSLPLSQYISMRWIGLESMKRIPKEWEWAFSVQAKCLGRCGINILFKNCWELTKTKYNAVA